MSHEESGIVPFIPNDRGTAARAPWTRPPSPIARARCSSSGSWTSRARWVTWHSSCPGSFFFFFFFFKKKGPYQQHRHLRPHGFVAPASQTLLFFFFFLKKKKKHPQLVRLHDRVPPCPGQCWWQLVPIFGTRTRRFDPLRSVRARRASLIEVVVLAILTTPGTAPSSDTGERAADAVRGHAERGALPRLARRVSPATARPDHGAVHARARPAWARGRPHHLPDHPAAAPPMAPPGSTAGSPRPTRWWRIVESFTGGLSSAPLFSSLPLHPSPPPSSSPPPSPHPLIDDPPSLRGPHFGPILNRPTVQILGVRSSPLSRSY